MKNQNEKQKKLQLKILLIIILAFIIYKNVSKDNSITKNLINNNRTLYILSSYENNIVENELKKYAKKIGKKIEFTYMGDLDIVEELNNNSKKYDAVWIANSMWLYMLDNNYLTSNSKSISISPIVFGIKESKAKSLDLVNKDITNKDILKLIQENKINYVMSSVTQTNAGATAYLGFLSSLAGNPEIMTEEILNNPTLINDLKDIFSGVERVSGDEKYLEEMFLKSTEYDTIMASESSIININKKLESENKEQLYLIYPIDGVAINDSTFAFIKNSPEKEETFLKIQNYLLSDEGQKMLAEKGQRTWYGGITNNPNETFNKKWGIDTTRYLNVTNFPSKKIITYAINLYIEKLRKPTHIVFCLDYSGSMYPDGLKQLTNAMDYILTYEKASADKLQFSEYDKISVIPFGSTPEKALTCTGSNTTRVLNSIKNKSANGATALYDAIIEGLKILNEENNSYTKTIIAMTDGEANVGSFEELSNFYHMNNYNIPVYSITFGSASEEELKEIAQLTNAKVFNGKTNLLQAFKEVRGYN